MGCKGKKDKATIQVGSRENKEHEGSDRDLKAGKEDFYFRKPDPLSCRNLFLKKDCRPETRVGH